MHTITPPAAAWKRSWIRSCSAQRIKSERASAYWFAASLWGVTGLVLGALLGGYMMLQAYVGLTRSVRETLVQGQAIQAAQDSVNSRRSSLAKHDAEPLSNSAEFSSLEP